MYIYIYIYIYIYVRNTSGHCSVLPAWDPVSKDLVLNGNITHSKPDSFYLERRPGFEWGMFRSFKTGSHTGRIQCSKNAVR